MGAPSRALRPPSAPVAVASLLALAACAGTGSTGNRDPRQGEVPLESAAEDWRAVLVLDRGAVGVWAVNPVPFFPAHGCPEVVALDDEGRCHVCVSYSGKWTPQSVLEDGEWLGAMAHADLDPAIPGAELYVAGKSGRIFQVAPTRERTLESRLVAELSGVEIHTLVAGEVDPANDGPELLAFTRPGALYRITVAAEADLFSTELLQELEGRVRDAVVLPELPGRGVEIVTASRAGTIELVRLTPDGLVASVIDAASMGRGRLALAPAVEGRGAVVYSTRDDGVVSRHEREGEDSWETETIFLGPQGPRGLAAGRFHEDPELESVAVFGYSGRVQLLTRRPAGGRSSGEWSVETLFVARDRGHWLAAAEVDGRNATDELVASGYGGRVVLLSRPVGYGREELADAPDRER